MTPFFIHLSCSLIATLGFCIIFDVPKKKLPACGIMGALSWMSYQLFIYFDMSQVLAAFIASCIVWLMSNIFSRIFKETSTMFIIPGIICLVPGAGMYYTMLAMMHNDLNEMASIGTETILTAGAIAAGLLAMGSVMSVIILFINRMIDTIKKASP